MRTRVSIGLASIAVIILLLGACAKGLNNASQRVCRGDQRRVATIVNGVNSSSINLTPEQKLAIGLVTTANGSLTCTGTLIAPRWVLTAKHCRYGDDVAINATDFRFAMGREDSQFSCGVTHKCISVTRVVEHHSAGNDLMLMELSEDATSENYFPAVQPMGLAFSQPLDRWADNINYLEAVGLGTEGVDSYISRNRKFVRLRVWGVGDQHLFTWGEGRHGVCGGDSGGPLIIEDEDGVVRIIGILQGAILGGASSANESQLAVDDCKNVDRFTRVDAYAVDSSSGESITRWIEATIGSPAGVFRSCRGGLNVGPNVLTFSELERFGECANGQWVHCDGSERVALTCPDDSFCGWDSNTYRFGCIKPENNPCTVQLQNGNDYHVSTEGVCDNNVAIWCERGEIKRRDCGSCNQVCKRVPAIRGVDCVADTCPNGLNGNGRCNDNVLEWCEDGSVKSTNCARIPDTECRKDQYSERFGCYPILSCDPAVDPNC